MNEYDRFYKANAYEVEVCREGESAEQVYEFIKYKFSLPSPLRGFNGAVIRLLIEILVELRKRRT